MFLIFLFHYVNTMPIYNDDFKNINVSFYV